MAVRMLVAAAWLVGSVLPAAAQEPVALQFDDGRVTLKAQNAQIRTILAEWARLGGVTVVNGERVAGPPVTLDLSDVPERQAIDVVLRNVAGYMLAPRPAGSGGASAFDRIMILPTSVAPRNPPPSAAAAPRPAIIRPPIIARPAEAGVDFPDEVPEEMTPDDPIVGPPVMPGDVPRIVPPTIVQPLPGDGPQPDDPDQETPEPGTPPGVGVTMPSNPFGIPAGSSTRPGVIAPVPQPQQGPANRVQ